MTIVFDAPPLNEVVVGVGFLPRPDFLIPYYGAFWERIKEHFPQVSHADPIVDPSDVAAGEEPSLLPRIWFLSEDNTTLVQLQQNRFLFNWREVDGQQNEYIRFKKVEAEFLRLWAMFDEFVTEKTGQPLQPTKFELTYINFIALDGAKDGFELAQRTFKNIAFPPAGKLAGPPRAFMHQYNTLLEGEAGALNIQIVSAARKAGDDGVKFELAVRGKHTSEMPFEKGISGAHDVIVSTFRELTTPEMHQKWGLREE